ncbi:MAG: DJ-1/PfpI family protein [Marinilabiliales bacterium]|nr:DJ-1/PfpI family protein [Marinilabiliales bacterium]
MKKILLLLAEGFEVLEAAAFVDVMGWNLVEGDRSTTLVSCGLKREVGSSFHQRWVVDLLTEEVDVGSFDALAIPGGFAEYGFYREAYDERFLELIREFSRQDKCIASICVGALPLGKSGILNHRKGTTYASDLRRQSLAACGVEVVHQPVVVDGKVITSWNPSTAIEVALTLLSWLTTKENAGKIGQLMGFTGTPMA